MPHIVSSSALRNSYAEMSAWCHETGEPAFITKNGNGDLAVMSIDAYEEMQGRLDLVIELFKGHSDVQDGNVHPARQGIATLKQSFGLE